MVGTVFEIFFKDLNFFFLNFVIFLSYPKMSIQFVSQSSNPKSISINSQKVSDLKAIQ